MSRPVLLAALLAAPALAGAPASAPARYEHHQAAARLVETRGSRQVFDNVRWGFPGAGRESAEYRRAAIDPSKVVAAEYWSEDFPPEWIAAHGLLAFIMEDDTGVVAADGGRAAGFVVSVEARFLRGQKFSLAMGFGDEFALVYQLTTLRDRLDFAVAMQGHDLHRYRLELDPGQVRQLARVALREAAVVRGAERYHTTRNNCVTSAVRMINQVLPRRRRMRPMAIPRLLANPRVFLPKLTLRTLRARGLAVPAGRISPEHTEAVFEDDRGWPRHRLPLAARPAPPAGEAAGRELAAALRGLSGVEAEAARLARLPATPLTRLVAADLAAAAAEFERVAARRSPWRQ